MWFVENKQQYTIALQSHHILHYVCMVGVKFVSPTIKTSVKFWDLPFFGAISSLTLNVSPFRKLGKFANFKALFLAV